MNFLKIKVWVHEALKTMRFELSELGWKEVFTAVKLQFGKITIFSLMPSIFCTINMVMGYDTLFLMWLMVVVSAYLMHKKEIQNEREQGLNSARAWIRFGTLIATFLLGSLGNYPTQDLMSSDEGYTVGLLNFAKLFPYFQTKTIQNVALYRLYLSAFGAIAVTTRKIKLELPEEAKSAMKKTEHIGTAKEVKTEKMTISVESGDRAESDPQVGLIKMSGESGDAAEIGPQLVSMTMSVELGDTAEIDLEQLEPVKTKSGDEDPTAMDLKSSEPMIRRKSTSGAVTLATNEIQIE